MGTGLRRLAMGVLCMVVTGVLMAQSGPRRGNGGGPPGGFGPPGHPARSVSQLVDDSLKRMLSFDGDQDGQLSRAEVSDARLQPLFDRADANQDNVLTKDELTDLFTKDAKELAASRPQGPPGGPGGPGGGPRRGPPGGGPPGPDRRGNGGGSPNR